MGYLPKCTEKMILGWAKRHDSPALLLSKADLHSKKMVDLEGLKNREKKDFQLVGRKGVAIDWHNASLHLSLRIG